MTSPEPVPEPAPEAPAVAADPSGEPVEAADLERIWPQLVASVRNELGARREAVLREAMPGGVSGHTLFFEVPAHMGFHLEQLQSDTRLSEYLTAKAGELLHRHVQVEFRSGDGGPATGATPAAAPEPAPEASGTRPLEVVPDEPEPIPDKDRLLEAPAEGTDPLALLSDELGAEVVEE